MTKQTYNPKDISFDAAGKKLGRLASEIALALRGKTSADFLPNRTVFPRITVKNVDAISYRSEQKTKKTEFARYSGYPSGRRVFTAHDVLKKDQRELLRRAVWGMLPKNRLRAKMIKNLTLYHADKN